ncbi:MAG: hypothetical protein F2825_00305 [Actinobacteria bacterium]|uniref:Unannotated protein n=1 Tax=freshwater metagenome TaxID=449393 RepID=A0A6J7FYE7_9ZZZZ|nr:hypothetical protein [Actinomycetota bacterium]
MSLTQQPTETDLGSGPRRSSGERAAVIAGVLVTVLALVGIAILVVGGGEDPAPPPPAPAAVDEPADTAPIQEPAQTPEDLAAAEAQERYREFLEVRTSVAQGGYQSSAPFDAVTVLPERAYQETAFRNAQRTPGLRQIGITQIASLSVTSVDLTPEPGGYPEVVLQACLDVSGVDIVDGTGKSVVLPEREERSKSTVTMYRYEPGTKGAETGGWFVYEATALNEPC